MTIVHCLLISACALLLAGCVSSNDPSDTGRRLAGIECTEPRRNVCPKIRKPVCATRDTGVRCVTTPCDSTEEITFPNGCLACADADVYRYTEGACIE